MATLLLLAPMGAQAQKSKQKKQVTDVPTIASADSAKIAIDSMLTAQDSSKLASLTQPAKPVRKKRNWATGSYSTTARRKPTSALPMC